MTYQFLNTFRRKINDASGGNHQASVDETNRPTATARNVWSRLSDLVQLQTKQLRRINRRQLQTRMAEHAAAVRRNDASSQVAAHSTGSGHIFKFDEAEILARGANRVSRELLKSWFTGPQSIDKCNDLPIHYTVLSLRLGGVIGQAGSAQVNTLPNARVSASDGRAIITPTSNARDEIAAINDANVGHHATCNDP
nr:unnamed protein product [Spirometra erinaceieuropaei]